MSKARYASGIAVFILVFFPLLFFIQNQLVNQTHTDAVEWGLLAAFGIGCLWHAYGVAFHRTGHAPDDSQDVGQLYEKGRLAVVKGNTELAAVCFEKLLRAHPADEDARYQLGRAYLKLRKPRQAARVLKHYLQSGGAKWRPEVEDLLRELKP